MNVVARKYNLENGNDDLLRLVEPLQKWLDLEELKREQNYKGVNRKRFDRLVKELDIKESAEELLQMLTP